MIEDGVKPEEVTDEKVGQYLFTAGVPDPDLIIRTFWRDPREQLLTLAGRLFQNGISLPPIGLILIKKSCAKLC